MMAMHIGPTGKSVKRALNGIMSILEARTDEKTKRVALGVLSASVMVKDVTVENCTFYGDGYKKGEE